MKRLAPPYENYAVDKDGNVWSSKRNKLWKILKTEITKAGYPKVTLCAEGRQTTPSVHRLVLETFGGPCPEGMECRHLNGDPSDNRLENLLWGTHQENVADMFKHGRVLMGESCKQSKLTENQVYEIRRRLSNKNESLTVLGRAFGVSRDTIFAIKQNRNWRWLTPKNVP